jgi:hypothetical protein
MMDKKVGILLLFVFSVLMVDMLTTYIAFTREDLYEKNDFIVVLNYFGAHYVFLYPLIVMGVFLILYKVSKRIHTLMEYKVLLMFFALLDILAIVNNLTLLVMF